MSMFIAVAVAVAIAAVLCYAMLCCASNLHRAVHINIPG
jgi:hypothetical protein